MFAVRPISSALPVIALAMTLCLVPDRASAFPVAEGAGAISSLIGIITSLIAGTLPKTHPGNSGNTRGRRIISGLVALCLLLGVLAVGLGAALKITVTGTSEGILAARQSRPLLEAEGEVIRQLEADRPAPPSEEDIDHLRGRGIIADPREYWSGAIAPDGPRLFVDFVPGARTHQPLYAAEPVEAGDADTVLRRAREEAELGRKPVLVSRDLSRLAGLSRLVERETGVVPVGLYLGMEEFSSGSRDGMPLLRDPDQVFGMELVELRDRVPLLETHSLINAVNIPLYDFLLMRDDELRDFFAKSPRRVVFIEYDEAVYGILNARLKEVEDLVPGDDYAFYEGGLSRHFFGDGESITPAYPNMRLADPVALMKVHARTGRLRFICTVPSQCLDNIPKDITINIPYRDMTRAEFRERVENLPGEYIYASVTSNQETYGNSLMTGYWLVRSGHQYAGDLVLQERFSNEVIREWIGWVSNEPGERTLENYRKADALFLGSAAMVEDLVRVLGWPLAFALLGIGVRLALLPAQIGVFRSYYSARPGFVAPVSAIVILGGLVGAFQLLNTWIGYYGVVPHVELLKASCSPAVFDGDLSRLMPGAPEAEGAVSVSRECSGDWSWLVPAFVTGVCLQVCISFPRRLHVAAGTGLIMLVVWGMLSTVSRPVMLFLLSGELTAIALQLPFFLRHIRDLRLRDRGIRRDILPGDDPSDLPSKWLLARGIYARYGDLVPKGGAGILVDLTTLPDGYDLTPFLPERQKDRETGLILRSADAGDAEQRLGGYFDSIRTGRDPREVREALASLKARGCGYAWIQAELEGCFGIVASIGRDGTRGAGLEGPAEAATEGRADARAFVAAAGGERSGVWKALRRAERMLGGPVLVEYATDAAGGVSLLQLRPQDPATQPEALLHPHGAGDVSLAEDYLARCSRITGDLIARSTGGLYIRVRGFLYRRPVNPPAPALSLMLLRVSLLWRGPKARLHDLEKSLIRAGRALSGAKDPAPGHLIAIADDLCSIHGDLFRLSQVPAAMRCGSRTLLEEDAISSPDGSELEVLGRKDIRLPGETGHGGSWRSGEADRCLSGRDHCHLLAAVATTLLGLVVGKLYPNGDIHERLGLDDILGSGTARLRDVWDVEPITGRSRESSGNRIIHPGPLKGSVICAAGIDPSGKDPFRGIEGGIILAGEEIPSQFVRHLGRVDGLVAVYGHASAHLGISARALDIPYRLVDRDMLGDLIRQGRVDIK